MMVYRVRRRVETVRVISPEEKERLITFSQRHHIRWLALFGSALRGDFGPESDIDFLVEFDPAHVPGLLGLARLERELSSLLGGRRVDLRTPRELSRYIRDEVRRQAEVIYAESGSHSSPTHA